jgi:CheY-like chemotaxis protein
VSATHPVRVLIVDDEADLREAMVFDFEVAGFAVDSASGGHEAFEKVRREAYDVVISDVRMAEGDGIELLDRIRAIDSQRPAVILISGYTDISLELAYDKGAEALFPKPYDRKQLFETVKSLALPAAARWYARHIRVPVQIQAGTASFASGLSIQSREINIGRGGFFLAHAGPFPRPGESCVFRIETGVNTVSEIKGEAIVRWNREIGEDGRPQGSGFEFSHLEDSGRNQMIRFVNFLKTKAFIPIR